MNKTAAYDADFHAWATESAALIRQGHLAELDFNHIAEELETDDHPPTHLHRTSAETIAELATLA